MNMCRLASIAAPVTFGLPVAAEDKIAALSSAGEYALVDVLGEKGINTHVWDFGVNPANPEARKSEPVKTAEPPVLLKRKKP